MKKTLLKIVCVGLLSMASCNNSTDDLSQDGDPNLDKIVKQKSSSNLLAKGTPVKLINIKVGATLNTPQLGTIIETLFLDNFNFFTPANAAKQNIVHPTPGNWDWTRVDEFINFAKDNNLTMRMHGPISPQCSYWAKNDIRTPEELRQNLKEFMTRSATRFNNNSDVVKYMDVVNETIKADGSFLTDSPGTNNWEVPWYKIGINKIVKNSHIPIYILDAFKIATEKAPKIKLVYNVQSGMQPVMWNKVKKTILRIRKAGHRVDGIGWQGHLMLNKESDGFVESPITEARRLGELIDWAHDNDLEFHVTELDYMQTPEERNDPIVYEELLKTQADAYQVIVDVLREKSFQGKVTLNLWDMGERVRVGRGYFQSIYRSNNTINPSYSVITNADKR